MPRIEFEADTIDELVSMARRWIDAGSQPGLEQPGSKRPSSTVPEDLVDVLARIRSLSSRTLLRDIADRSLVGEASPLGKDVQVGVLGVINRTMRRRAQRALVVWDAVASGYRMDPSDARVVTDVLGPPPARLPEAGEQQASALG